MAWLQHIGLTTSNLKLSEKFYVENFGFKTIVEKEISARLMQEIFGYNSPAQLIFLKAEKGQEIELFHFPELKEAIPQIGKISHFTLAVDDHVKYFEKLKNSGCETIAAKKEDGGMVYFVKDPDGNLIELRDE
ncbi:MAG: VOC family protein [Candidatus Margulisbacteria bacterium]|nr:VOC family protein [Candidatus Margulisiibacteriota bacterium]MBU1022578.1 VOC family protein [Candidatus Margulisiibacteriota bacterium]MBU1728864.1 VOC family protein [Candidatus Margulisiibacteriota bacterium]